MAKSVFCTVTNRVAAEDLVQQLKLAGFANSDISVLMSDKVGTKDFAIDNQTKAPEGAATGMGTGMAAGGILGWLAGIGTLAIPGVGPLIAAGPIMAALGGAAVGGAIGGIAGILIGMGIPEYEAKMYEGKLKSGSALISVHSDNSEQTDRAKQLMQAAGAENISSSSEPAAAARTR
jgi:hypothetical protein